MSNGTRLAVGAVGGKTPLGLPPWAAELPGGEFHGLVLDGSDLYLVAVHQQRLGDGRMFSLVSSVPVDRAVMDMIADGSGRVAAVTSRCGQGSGRSDAARRRLGTDQESERPARIERVRSPVGASRRV